MRFARLPYNLPARLEDRQSARLSAMRRELIRAQGKSGAWETDGALETHINTCQAVLALCILGDSRDTVRVERAVNWLAKPSVMDEEYAYWALAVFNCVDGWDDETNSAFLRCNELALTGLRHHKNSPLFEFVCEQARLLGKASTFADAHMKTIEVEIDDSEKRSLLDAHVLSYKYLVLCMYGKATADRSNNVCKALLARATVSDVDVSWPGNVASTAYVHMNLRAIRDIADETCFDELIRKAFAGIIGRIDSNNFDHPLPAGGQFKNPRIYTIAVALRAIAAHEIATREGRKIGIMAFDRGRSRRLAMKLAGVLTVAATLIVVVGPFLLGILRANDLLTLAGLWLVVEKVGVVWGLFGISVIAIWRSMRKWAYAR